MKILSLAAIALLVLACADAMPEIRPLPGHAAADILPFDSVYAAGKAHLAANRVGLAVVMFRRALAIDPLSVAALNATGTAYDELHRPDLAGGYYAKALAIEPNSADTLNNMAVSAAMVGDQEQARELIAQALSIEPSNQAIRQNAGLVGATGMPILPAQIADENRPSIERTGLSELTLNIPAGSNG
jgi:Flp pilus assembly protein TadD